MGRLTLECDRPKCHGETVVQAEDVTFEPRRHGGLDLEAYADGWVIDDEGGLVCPQCAEENPREKHDDDGKEFGDPRDHRDGRE